MRTMMSNELMLIESDQLHNKWISETGRLDHDVYVLQKLVHFLGLGNILDIGPISGPTLFSIFSTWRTGSRYFHSKPTPWLSHVSATTARLPCVCPWP
jgi:hypothetical protein